MEFFFRRKVSNTISRRARRLVLTHCGNLCLGAQICNGAQYLWAESSEKKKAALESAEKHAKNAGSKMRVMKFSGS